MVDKPANQDLSQGFSNIFSTSSLETLYEGYMDSMLSLLGRNVTVFLPPAVTPVTTNPSQFNPFTREQDRRTANQSNGNTGTNITPITVTYKAHVVHGPRMLSDVTKNVQFALDVGDVQLTLVYGAMEDMSKAVEIEVDGIRYDIKKHDIRPIGLSSTKYLICVWSKKSSG